MPGVVSSCELQTFSDSNYTVGQSNHTVASSNIVATGGSNYVVTSTVTNSTSGELRWFRAVLTDGSGNVTTSDLGSFQSPVPIYTGTPLGPSAYNTGSVQNGSRMNASFGGANMFNGGYGWSNNAWASLTTCVSNQFVSIEFTTARTIKQVVVYAPFTAGTGAWFNAPTSVTISGMVDGVWTSIGSNTNMSSSYVTPYPVVGSGNVADGYMVKACVFNCASVGQSTAIKFTSSKNLGTPNYIGIMEALVII